MKICIVGPVYPYRGGIAHYTSRLAQALERHGHAIQVISFRRQYPALLYPGKTDKDPSSDAIRVPAQYILDPLYPWTWWQAAKLISGAKPDMALFQWWSTFWAPAYFGVARRLSPVPVAFLIHNVLPHESKPWDASLARLALGQGRGFIVQTARERERLQQLVRTPVVRLCNHPVYSPFSKETVAPEAARKRLGLPLDSPVVLDFGIVRPYKGLGNLLEALAGVTKPLHLVVAGEFWESAANYRSQIDRLGIAERVTIFDRYIPNEEAHLLFSAADALVAPYIAGTQSGAVELAIGYGLPAITTDGIARGIAGADPGALRIVAAGDITALSNALMDIAERRISRSRPQRSGDDWDRMVQAVEELAGELIARPGVRGRT